MTRRFTLQYSTRTVATRRPGAVRPEPVDDHAFLEAMERLSSLPNSVNSRTPEEWAELDRTLMTDEPINLGNPEATPRRT